MKSSIAVAALLAASLGVAAIAPVAAQTTSSSAETTTSSSSSAPAATSSSAEPTTTAPAPANDDAAKSGKPMRPMQGMRNPGMGSGPRQMILNLTCSDRGPAVVERMLGRMEKNLKLNADHTKLFADFKAKALTNATSFADTCKSSRPAPNAGERPNVLDALKSEVAVDTARLAALNDTLPSFEAFFNSLTDQQKADLFPRRGMGMDRHNNDRQNQRGPGADRQARPQAPGR